MIINKINIEGMCHDDEIKKLSLKGSNIFNKSIDIKIDNRNGIKDIMEISLETDILNIKTLEFGDGSMMTITVETSFNILAIENQECNTLSIIEKKDYFNYSFNVEEKNISKDDITIKVIDCFFKIGNKQNIVGTLTYLIREKIEKVVTSSLDVTGGKYKLIDLCQEFC